MVHGLLIAVVSPVAEALVAQGLGTQASVAWLMGSIVVAQGL